jgi:hypothetical protein
MQRAKTRLYSTLLLMLMLLMLSASSTAQKKDKVKEKENAANLPAVIWRDPGDVASLNLLYGAGGKAHAPDPNGTYTFVKEDLKGSSPKFDVEDAQGVGWKVKLGAEPQSETAATRFLWAAGYFVDEDYYLAEFKVTGMPKLHRGNKFISADGTVHGARLERKSKEEKKLDNWDWFANPFLDKREFNGLRIMMALVNNWDLKEINNSIYEVGDERRYAVTDLGATFGKTGNSFSRSRSVLKDYVDSKFIKKATPEYVDFVMHSRPIFLTVITPYYHTRARMEKITRHVPRADVKWLAQRLSQLSEEQIRDSFRAAGYTAEEIEGYTKAVQKRIAELNAL